METSHTTSQTTNKALKELQKQILAQSEVDETEGKEDHEEEISDGEENLILQRFRSKNGNTNNNTNNNNINNNINNNNKYSNQFHREDIVSTLLAQHELDRNKISKLTKNVLMSELDTERQEMKLHYMRLDYNNTSISLTEANEKLKTKTKHNSSLTFKILLLYVMLSVSCIGNAVMMAFLL